MTRRWSSLPVVVAAVLAGVTLWQASPGAQQVFIGWARFDAYLEAIRTQARVPGLSAVILKDRDIVWDRGLGFADVEGLVRATTDTPYHVVGLTQTLSAALLLDCVERGRATLDTPARTFAPDVFPDNAAALRHVLSHTSDPAPPGSAFRYDLQRYSALTPAIERCWSGRSYREVMKTEVLNRFGMVDSVPGVDIFDPEIFDNLPDETYDQDRLDAYASVLARLAKPYKTDKSKPVAVEYPSRSFDAASGLVTTVRDLATFDVAIGDGILLDPETVEAMWTPPTPLLPIGLPPAASARPLPHGLGWFVQTYQGQRIVWQLGQWPGVTSSLIVKVPAKNLTFIIMANSDGLAPAGALETGDVTVSLFARLFLRYFL
jgi:CubicO group peptidase (beta-lactamase class C family)